MKATLLQLPALAFAAGYRTAGSSGCHAQMVFLPPFTDTAVFLDKYVLKQHCQPYAHMIQLPPKLWWPRSKSADWRALKNSLAVYQQSDVGLWFRVQLENKCPSEALPSHQHLLCCWCIST